MKRGHWLKSREDRGLIKRGDTWYVRCFIDGIRRVKAAGPDKEFARQVLKKLRAEALERKFFGPPASAKAPAHGGRCIVKGCDNKNCFHSTMNYPNQKDYRYIIKLLPTPLNALTWRYEKFSEAIRGIINQKLNCQFTPDAHHVDDERREVLMLEIVNKCDLTDAKLRKIGNVAWFLETVGYRAALLVYHEYDSSLAISDELMALVTIDQHPAAPKFNALRSYFAYKARPIGTEYKR